MLSAFVYLRDKASFSVSIRRTSIFRFFGVVFWFTIIKWYQSGSSRARYNNRSKSDNE